MANHSQKMFARYLSDKLIPEKKNAQNTAIKKKQKTNIKVGKYVKDISPKKWMAKRHRKRCST